MTGYKINIGKLTGAINSIGRARRTRDQDILPKYGPFFTQDPEAKKVFDKYRDIMVLAGMQKDWNLGYLAHSYEPSDGDKPDFLGQEGFRLSTSDFIVVHLRLFRSDTAKYSEGANQVTLSIRINEDNEISKAVWNSIIPHLRHYKPKRIGENIWEWYLYP